MKIRKFAKEDLPEVLELCREVRQHHIDVLNGYFKEQNDEFEQMPFLESLENGKIVAFVAEEDNKVVGYLLGEFKNAPYLVHPDIAHISNFGVSKNHRSKGIGKALMNVFYELCKENKICEIRLGVYNQNISAYKFYENYGFEPLEQRMVLDISKNSARRL